MLKRLIRHLLLVANILAIALLWICCICTTDLPKGGDYATLFALLFPVLLCVNLFFVAAWLLFKSPRALYSFAGVLLVGGFVLDYFPLNIFRSKPKREHAIMLVSYNMGDYSVKHASKQFLNYFKSVDADIWCLQEIPAAFMKPSFEEEIKARNYHVQEDSGRCIISRFPFVGKAFSLPGNSGNNYNGVMVSKIFDGKDTISVINCHLQSNSLSRTEKAQYANTLRRPTEKNVATTFAAFYKKMKRSAVHRRTQTIELCGYLDNHMNDHIIVAGDFNDTPISFVYQQMDKRMESAWRNSGIGLGRSFNQTGFPVRIDHIFYSSHWNCHYVTIDDKVMASDHNPIIAFLEPKGGK